MQYIQENDDGLFVVERNDVVVPAYQIGQTVIYKMNDLDVEGKIVGYVLEASVKHGELVYIIVYETDIGDTIFEEDVDKYYEIGDEG